MRCPECARDRTQVKTLRSIAAEPTVTYVLIAICAMAFVGELASGSALAQRGGGTIIDKGGLSAFGIAHQHEYWRLVTSGFLHAGLIHIAFNMYLLYILGQMLEPAIGHLRFAVIYVTGLLGGSLGALVVSPNSLTVGASGAVFGLMGAAVIALRSRGIDPMESGIPALIAFNLLFSFVVPGISVGGHIGGLLAGGVAAFLLVDVGERARSQALGLAATAALCVGLVVASLSVA